MEPDSESRLVVEAEPRDGVWNMAVDEALLEAAIERNETTLRFYRWSAPTVSLGYFQDPGAVDAELAALPMVRRLSGGGAILHHHELTYSLALPRGSVLAQSPVEIYRVIHDAIVELLNERGAPVRLRGEERAVDAGERSNGEPFLCFSRGDARDVVSGGFKIAGSAQRRRRGAVLQHGSLLLKRSPHAPAFPGLYDLHPDAPIGIAELLAVRLSGVFGCVSRSSTIPNGIHRRTLELAPTYAQIETKPERKRLDS